MKDESSENRLFFQLSVIYRDIYGHGFVQTYEAVSGVNKRRFEEEHVFAVAHTKTNPTHPPHIPEICGFPGIAWIPIDPYGTQNTK